MKFPIKLRIDSRDLIHSRHFYGDTNDIPNSCNFDDNSTNEIEAQDGEDCTAISDCSVAHDQTKVVYDINDLWNQVPNNSNGVDPRVTLGIMISQGLLPIGQTVRDKRWQSYFIGHKGQFTPSVNLQNTMTIAQSSITICTPWYQNFDVMTKNSIMPQGDTHITNHDWKITGWTEINDVTMFICKAWQGFVFYCPFNVFDWLMGQTGSTTYMPATAQIMAIRQRSIIEWILDAVQNCLLLIKESLL